MQYCCLKMEGALEEYGTPLQYTPYTRSYSMEYGTVFKNKDSNEPVAALAEFLIYCPWCGKKLPKNLFADWIKTVKTKFKVLDTLDKNELKKIPEEYMTDEWWKKKGL